MASESAQLIRKMRNYDIILNIIVIIKKGI